MTIANSSHYVGDDVTIVVEAGTYAESDSISASSLNSLTIAGMAAATTTINGNQSGSVLDVTGGTVTISGLTVTNGSLAGAGGGGIANSGILTVDHSIVSNNVGVVTPGSAASGGGIYNSGGTLTVTNSTLSGNSAPTGSGGGIYSTGGTLTVTNSTFSGNSALGGSGGGIYNGGGTLTVDNSTLSGNSSASGGGIYNGSGGTLTVTNTTFSGNSALGGSGGGIYNGGGTLTVDNSTLSGNSSSSGGGTLGGVGPVNLAASILANGPSGGNCGANTGGVVSNGGYNLADDATCGTIPNSATLDASLGALADNGGPTQTLLPALGSPAIGAIPTGATSNPVRLCPRIDQRGVASSGNCTIGAVEGGFRIDTTSLPVVTPGLPYGPVQLMVQEVGVSAANFVTKLKWKKVSLPKGLKLSHSGVLSGTPSKRLTPGPSSVVVLASEKVFTLNASDKKVTTETSFELTIPIAIPTFGNVVKSAENSAAQSNLQTALTAAKTYYTQNNQSYTGLDPTTFAEIDTGLTAVDGSTASNDPNTISIFSSSDYVVLSAWSKASTCWSIIDNAGFTTLEGYAGQSTIYLTSPAVTESECSAATFNSATAIPGAVVSYSGFPKQ